jgi:hypothetical protein
MQKPASEWAAGIFLRTHRLTGTKHSQQLQLFLLCIILQQRGQGGDIDLYSGEQLVMDRRKGSIYSAFGAFEYRPLCHSMLHAANAVDVTSNRHDRRISATNARRPSSNHLLSYIFIESSYRFAEIIRSSPFPSKSRSPTTETTLYLVDNRFPCLRGSRIRQKAWGMRHEAWGMRHKIWSKWRGICEAHGVLLSYPTVPFLTLCFIVTMTSGQ